MICKVCLEKITKPEKYESYHDECFRATFGTVKINPILPFSRSEFKTDRAKRNNKRFSISGVQPKLLINIQEDTLEVTEINGTHIIKVSPEEYPYASENEHLTMKIFRHMKIETAKCGLMELKDKELVYITKRFDRSSTGKIHQEDMMQAMGIANSDNSKYESKSYEDIGRFLFTNGKNLVVVGEFFKRVVLNFLVGNDDYHLKNISIRPEFIHEGSKFLTPVYDSLNTDLYKGKESLSGELALGLISDNEGFTKHFEINGFHTKKCFDEFAVRIGLNPKFTNEFYQGYEKSFSAIINLVQNSFLPIDAKKQYEKNLRERLKKLLT